LILGDVAGEDAGKEGACDAADGRLVFRQEG